MVGGEFVDHTTLYRWVQQYAPELEKRTLWYRNRLSVSWRVDETYLPVLGLLRQLGDRLTVSWILVGVTPVGKVESSVA